MTCAESRPGTKRPQTCMLEGLELSWNRATHELISWGWFERNQGSSCSSLDLPGGWHQRSQQQLAVKVIYTREGFHHHCGVTHTAEQEMVVEVPPGTRWAHPRTTVLKAKQPRVLSKKKKKKKNLKKIKVPQCGDRPIFQLLKQRKCFCSCNMNQSVRVLQRVL